MNEIDNKLCLDHPSIFNNITLIYWQHWDIPTLVQNSLYHLKGKSLFMFSMKLIRYLKKKMSNGWIRVVVKIPLIFLPQCIFQFDEQMQIIHRNYHILIIIHLQNLLKSNFFTIEREKSRIRFV
jgi:hypothetical protein